MLIQYGWYLLLIAITGEIIIPYILGFFYSGYKHRKMVISSLGIINSPVRIPFNIWMLIAGILFLLSTPAIHNAYYHTSKPLTIAIILFMAIFAIGACIFTCFFSVNESKDIVTTASKIHGVGSVIGFMLFQLIPLFMGILSFRAGDTATGVVSILCFIFAILFFVLFIMADKPSFSHTIIANEGMWQRLNLIFMYIPLGFVAVNNMFLS